MYNFAEPMMGLDRAAWDVIFDSKAEPIYVRSLNLVCHIDIFVASSKR